MSKSLRDQEGYLLLDHRHAQPVPDDLVTAAGLPMGAGRGLFEAPTFTCKHCQRVVVMNPNRSQPRHHCRGCDHLICDGCAAIKAVTHQCRTFDQLVDSHLTQISSGG